MFDVIIFSFLILAGAFLTHVFVEWRHHQRHPLLWWAAVLVAVAWGTVFYGSFVEPRMLVTRHVDLALSQGSQDSIKIALFSDLHVGRYKDAGWTQHVVDAVNKMEPDVVLIPGDFIFNGEASMVDLDPLKNLRAKEGVYAVTGNHDYEGDRAPDVVAKLEEAGITVLQNEAVPLRSATADRPKLLLAGVSDIWFDGNVGKALAGARPEDDVILLAHNPDVALDPAASVADVILAAHTHGGQIRLPFIGPVGIIPTKLGQAYDKGLFSASAPGAAFGADNRAQRLYITSGTGETGPRARLFNPPEVALIFLER